MWKKNATVAVVTGKAPPPLPFFSQAVKTNGMIYCSGSIGTDPATKKIVEGGVGARTVRALINRDAGACLFTAVTWAELGCDELS